MTCDCCQMSCTVLATRSAFSPLLVRTVTRGCCPQDKITLVSCCWIVGCRRARRTWFHPCLQEARLSSLRHELAFRSNSIVGRSHIHAHGGKMLHSCRVRCRRLIFPRQGLQPPTSKEMWITGQHSVAETGWSVVWSLVSDRLAFKQVPHTRLRLSTEDGVGHLLTWIWRVVAATISQPASGLWRCTCVGSQTRLGR